MYKKIINHTPIALILMMLINFIFVISIVKNVNDKHKQIDEKIIKNNEQVEAFQRGNIDVKQQDNNKTVEFLRQEYSNYRDFANNDRSTFIQLVNLFFIALGILVTGGIVVIYWMFGQTRKEVIENLESNIKLSSNTIEEKVKREIEIKINEEIESKYKELLRFMENEYSLRKSKVLILCPEEKKEEMENLEAMRLRQIVDEVRILDLKAFEEFKRKLNNNELDIIVYRYEKPTEKKEQEGTITIRDYIQELKYRNLSIPMVVYAKNGIRVEGEDEKSVNSYPYSIMANMPTSLTSNMMSLANALSYEKR